MKSKEFNLILDIKKHIKQDYIEVVQGDINTNVLNIQLYDGLEILQLPGLDVEIVFAKPDGTTVIQNNSNGVIVVGNKIICTLLANTIAANGSVIAEVRVLEGINLLTSARFEFYVRKSLVNDETIESTNEFGTLTQLIATTESLIDQVGLIEKQVPEQVVIDLNAVSVLATQLQTELGEHKEEYAHNKNITSTDIDTIKIPGFYYGYNVINSASVETSVFIVQVYSIDWIKQTQYAIKPDGAINVYNRTFFNGTTWSAWIDADAKIDNHVIKPPTQSELGHVKLPSYPLILPLQNGWVGRIAYSIDAFGTITLNFNAYGGIVTPGTIIATLPDEYRPAGYIRFDAIGEHISYNQTDCYFVIDTLGRIKVGEAAIITAGYSVFNTVTFRVI